MIRLRLSDTPEEGGYEYSIACHSLYSDIPLDPIHPYLLGKRAELNESDRNILYDPVAALRVYSGEAWVVDRSRAVSCDSIEQGFLLELEDLGSFFVERDGKYVKRISNPSDVTDIRTLTHTVLGAPLILSLALQQVFCLHASAISFNKTVIGFVGDSGSGKSTIAAYFSDVCRQNAIRISDDILPVESNGNGIVALPHFPQLKLESRAHYPLSSTARVPLQQLFVLCPSSEKPEVRLEPLDQRNAALALIHHSVGTRLFDRELLEKHWSFCMDACEHLSVTRLSFPQKIESLPVLIDRIREEAERTVPEMPLTRSS